MAGKNKPTEFIVVGNNNSVATTDSGKVRINGQEHDAPATITDDRGNTVTVK